MRILIVRSGSGWGGIVCRYLIDTSEKIIVDLLGCYKLKKDSTYFDEEKVLKLSLDNFPSQAMLEFNYNIDLLESFLSDCELHEEPCMMMDHQIDSVYVLDKDDNIRCVYDTDGFIWPENAALCAKLQKLVELCV